MEAGSWRTSHRRQHPVWQGGDAGDLAACGVADRVQDGGGGGDQDMFAKAFGAERAFGIGHLDQQAVDGGHVAGGGDQVVMQVVGAARDVILHQRKADALGDAALDLALGQRRVDRAAHVMGGGDAGQVNRAQGGVHLQFHHLRAVAVLGIGVALPHGVQRGGWRIVGFLG